MFLVCVLLQVALVTVSASVSYLDCGSVYEIRAVNIAGCSSSQPCYLTLGDQVQVNLQFYADLRARNLRQNVIIDINQLHLSATVTPERCEVPNCPARHSGSYTSFNSTMTVPSRMVLNQRGYLRWRITNEEGRLILCYAVLVQTRSRRLKYIRQYQSMIPGRQSVEPKE